MTPPVVLLRDGVVALDGRHVLHRVNLTVRSGEVVALLGSNGSGKTTMVKALLGLVALSGGSVKLFGRPLSQFRDWRRIGYVPQRLTAASGAPATVSEVVSSGRLSRIRWWQPPTPADRRAVRHALDTVRLTDRAKDGVGQLSGGQQQRVLIARALASEPELLILDEPTAGVDQSSQQAFAEALATMVRRGTTILLVAHELGPLEILIKRAVALDHGRVIHDGPSPPGCPVPADHDHAHPYAHQGEHFRGWLR